MKKRRYRMLVEMTFDKPVAEEIARSTCERVFSGQDFQRIAHEQATRCGATLVKHVVKNAERVFQQDARRALESVTSVVIKADQATSLSIMNQEYDRLCRVTSGETPVHVHPRTGGEKIICFGCGGTGSVNTPDEQVKCANCGGSGRNWKYPDGSLAAWEGGPFIGGTVGARS